MVIMSVEDAKSPWITWFKEIVTASLGIMIIVGMFLLLWPLLNRGTPDITNAQAIFSILGGWGGVVLGYYFGRIPAERAATKAEAVASVAEKAKMAAVTSENTTLVESESLISEMEETLETYKKTIINLKKRIDEL